jgi:hypothetical protein
MNQMTDYTKVGEGGYIMTKPDGQDPKGHFRNDNNHQSLSKVHGGELKSGRLSQIKNNNPADESVPNEYINKSED